MLSQIQERDAQLIKVNENLEQTVHNRTMELEKELGERKRAEEQLGKLNEELSQSNQELDNFAYIASHDLKEPLRGIHNYSAFLLEDYGGKFDPDGQSKLETLKRLTQRMEDIINSLLQFSRVGRVDLALRDVDLNEVISEVVNLLDISLKEQNVKIIIPEPLPVIYCDRARIGEVFQNLITNGMKYNVSAEKRIEIGTVAPDHFDSKQVNSEVVFYVRDNGIGIPPKHHENVFNIFKRLHSREKYGGGTGAGLTIVKKIVERHHGSIWIESEQGAGTTFYFTLETRSENLERTSSAYTGS
jgi:two-component system, chemotaxis family, sensor kinase Cph1